MEAITETRGWVQPVESSAERHIVTAADAVIASERRSISPSARESVAHIVGRYAKKGMLGLAALSLITQAGCGNVGPVDNQAVSHAGQNAPPPATEMAHPGQFQAPGAPEVVQMPFVERGQLKALPKDVLSSEYLQSIGVTITNIGEKKLHLRKGILGTPLFDMLKKAHSVQNAKALDLHMVVLSDKIITKSAMNKISDAHLKDLLITNYKEDGRSNKDGWSIITQDKEGGLHYYVVVALGGDIDPERDDLPDATESSDTVTFSNLGKQFLNLLRHEMGHFPADTLPGMDTDEPRADQRALQYAQNAQQLLKDRQDDSLYYFAIQQGNRFVRVGFSTNVSPKPQAA